MGTPTAPINATPYELVYEVMNRAHARLNGRLDTLAPVSGKILGNTIPFTQQTVNNAYQWVQELLADRGYQRLIGEVIITAFPVTGTQDPAKLSWLSWDGCFDGENFFKNPALPKECTHPLKIWERWSGINSCFDLKGMEKVLGGLPMYSKDSANSYWEWRDDKIYIPGSLRVEDFRIRYVKYLAPFVDVPTIHWFQQEVQIARGGDALSWAICMELESSRGGQRVEEFKGLAESATDRVFNLDVRADESVNIRRQPRSRRGGRRGWAYC